MTHSVQLIAQYREFARFVEQLKSLSEAEWSMPVTAGKVSVREIVGHLLNWDQHLGTQVIPAAREGLGLYFPEFDAFNEIGYAYARTVQQEVLIDQFIYHRHWLCEQLQRMPTMQLLKPTTANGAYLCPRSGKPYSLLYIIEEMIDHDQYHQRYLQQALSPLSSSVYPIHSHLSI
ncbi:DinB family protein [Marinicrinis sediminis]|uniref:DinB family protein n=1 Tax=Marinicrinis sediminis TaxID=1652465 RepID=A0ABW5RE38_9BACL